MVLEGSFLFQVSENQQQINTFVEEKQRNVSCPFMSLVFDQTWLFEFAMLFPFLMISWSVLGFLLENEPITLIIHAPSVIQ